MKLSRFLFVTTVVTLCFILNLVRGGGQQRSVLLEDVKTLTLQKGQKTQARRTSPIPQLKCVGGTARGSYEPDVVQCYNRGSDGADIQWECTSEMPKKFKFGKLSVSCEGYAYPDDPYILAGSCGLEYNLDLTDASYHDTKHSSHTRLASDSKPWPFLVKAAILVAIFLALRSFLSSRGPTTGGAARPMSAGPDHRPPGGGGGGGGWFSNLFPGGGGAGGLGGFGNLGNTFGNWFGGAPGQGNTRRGQPPPPGFRNDYTDYGDTCAPNRQQTNTAGGGTGNFLSGAALGAMGGYLFGRNRGPQQQQYAPNTANTGWFGGGTTTHRRSPSPTRSSASTHTSTGYGGTTRR